MDLIDQVALFCAVSFASMVVAYVRIWANESPDNVTLWQYLTSDKRAVARAMTTLLTLWAAAGGFDYLSGMSDKEIIGAAIGLGLMVPQRAAAQQVSDGKEQDKDNLGGWQPKARPPGDE